MAWPSVTCPQSTSNHSDQAQKTNTLQLVQQIQYYIEHCLVRMFTLEETTCALQQIGFPPSVVHIVWKQLEHENPQFFLLYRGELAKRCSWLQGLGTTLSCKGLDTLGQAECWSRPWQSPTLWSPVTRHRVFFLLLLLLIIWLACTAQQDKVPIIKQMSLYYIPMMALLLIHLCSTVALVKLYHIFWCASCRELWWRNVWQHITE